MLGDLNKLKVVELKAELANRGLDTKGVKAVLVDRLKAALVEEGGGAPLGSSLSGTEDPRSSQESNDEAEESPTTPTRRGRRETSVVDVQSEPTFASQVGENEVVSASIQEELSPSPAAADKEASSSEDQELLESSRLQEQEQISSGDQEEEHHLDSGLELQPSVKSEDQLLSHDSSPARNEESSESKESCEDFSSEHHNVEVKEKFGRAQSPSEEDDSEPASQSKPFVVQSEEDSEQFLPEVEGASHNTDGSTESKEFDEPVVPAVNTHDGVDIKVEPPDVPLLKVEDGISSEVLDNVKEEQAEGSRRARKSRFTDNDDVAQGATEVKEEPMDSDTVPVEADAQVKCEPSSDRKRRRSSSRSPRRSRSPPLRRQEDEPEIDDNAVLLSWYDSDLNLVIEKGEFVTATPMHQQGFGYVWAGARASHGFTKGKVCFEAKCLEECDVSHLEDEPNPHVLRVGWSVQGTSMQLGEEKLSFGYGGTGKSSVNCQFKDYGKSFGVGDTVSAYLDMDSEPKVLTYCLNGEPLGVAYEISSDALGDKALFPHVLTKNIKFSVNFSGEPSYPLMEGFVLCGNILPENRVNGPKRPEKKEDCEMIMMCGLPGCGKTCWANEFAEKNPEKLYNILGTNNLIDKMKVMGLPRKRNYAGRWEVLIDKCTKCLSKLFEVAGRRRRNYILDQTNVYPSAVKRKMNSFDGFKRRAIVIVPADDEYQRRVAKREAEEGKDVPDHAVLEMKANFKVPEIGDIFSEVVYTELPEEEARAMVEKYREEAKQKGVVAQTHPSKRFKSERSGSSGDRRFDDRHSSRDGRDYRDRRDYRDNRDNRDYRDRGNSYRPRGGPGGDRNRSGWQPRGGQGGGWRDSAVMNISICSRNDSYRGGRPDNRGSWRSGGGRGGMGGGYDRHRGGGYNQSRGGYSGGRGGSKSWGYNQGSGGSSWGNWNQQAQPDYSQQWQGQNQGQSSGYNSSWKGYGQQQPSQHQSYGQQTGYSTTGGYSSYGNGSNYNWNQQYYQNYGGWSQQQQGATSASAAVAGTGAASSTAVASAGTTYDPYQQWSQFPSYGYSTSSGSATAGAAGSASHGGK